MKAYSSKSSLYKYVGYGTGTRSRFTTEKQIHREGATLTKGKNDDP